MKVYLLIHHLGGLGLKNANELREAIKAIMGPFPPTKDIDEYVEAVVVAYKLTDEEKEKRKKDLLYHNEIEDLRNLLTKEKMKNRDFVMGIYNSFEKAEEASSKMKFEKSYSIQEWEVE